MSEITGIIRDSHSFILGMQLAMRIVRNRVSDIKEIRGRKASPEEIHELATAVAMIRLVQVEIGSGRSPVPSNWTPDEIDEVERIS